MRDVPVDDALVEAILALGRWLSAGHVPYAVIGGVAVALQAAPRFTNDVDAVIWIDDARWPELIGAAEAFAITPRRPDVLEFAARTRVLLLAHASGVSIDVSCGALPFEQALIERATRMDLGTLSVRVAQPQDLLVMKALANRPRDRADIETLLRQLAPSSHRSSCPTFQPAVHGRQSPIPHREAADHWAPPRTTSCCIHGRAVVQD